MGNRQFRTMFRLPYNDEAIVWLNTMSIVVGVVASLVSAFQMTMRTLQLAICAVMIGCMIAVLINDKGPPLSSEEQIKLFVKELVEDYDRCRKARALAIKLFQTSLSPVVFLSVTVVVLEITIASLHPKMLWPLLFSVVVHALIASARVHIHGWKDQLVGRRYFGYAIAACTCFECMMHVLVWPSDENVAHMGLGIFAFCEFIYFTTLNIACVHSFFRLLSMTLLACKVYAVPAGWTIFDHKVSSTTVVLCMVTGEAFGQLYLFIHREILKNHAEKMEQSRLEHERNIKLAMEGTMIPIAMVDAKMNFSLVNPAMCKMFGYTKEELLAKNFGDIFNASTRKKYRSYMAEYERTRQGTTIGKTREKVTCKQKDGKIFLQRLTLAIAEEGESFVATFESVFR